MSLRELLSQMNDSLVYLVAYYPQLPHEDGVTANGVLQRIRKRMQNAFTLKLTDAQCHWLKLCDTELAAAETGNEAGDAKGVARSLKEARDYLNKARKNFHAVPDFLIIDQTTVRPQN